MIYYQNLKKVKITLTHENSSKTSIGQRSSKDLIDWTFHTFNSY